MQYVLIVVVAALLSFLSFGGHSDNDKAELQKNRAAWVKACIYGVDSTTVQTPNGEMVDRCTANSFKLFPEKD